MMLKGSVRKLSFALASAVLGLCSNPASAAGEYARTIDGRVSIALLCGDDQNGIEVYLGDRWQVEIRTISGRNDFLKYQVNDYRIGALVVPWQNGSPVITASSTHTVETEPDRYIIKGWTFGRFLNWHDFENLAPLSYHIYRDGSRVSAGLSLGAVERRRRPHPATILPGGEVSNCRSIDSIDPQIAAELRLEEFSKAMESRYNDLIQEREDAAKDNKF